MDRVAGTTGKKVGFEVCPSYQGSNVFRWARATLVNKHFILWLPFFLFCASFIIGFSRLYSHHRVCYSLRVRAGLYVIIMMKISKLRFEVLNINKAFFNSCKYFLLIL